MSSSKDMITIKSWQNEKKLSFTRGIPLTTTTRGLENMLTIFIYLLRIYFAIKFPSRWNENFKNGEDGHI